MIFGYASVDVLGSVIKSHPICSASGQIIGSIRRLFHYNNKNDNQKQQQYFIIELTEVNLSPLCPFSLTTKFSFVLSSPEEKFLRIWAQHREEDKCVVDVTSPRLVFCVDLCMPHTEQPVVGELDEIDTMEIPKSVKKVLTKISRSDRAVVAEVDQSVMNKSLSLAILWNNVARPNNNNNENKIIKSVVSLGSDCTAAQFLRHMDADAAPHRPTYVLDWVRSNLCGVLRILNDRQQQPFRADRCRAVRHIPNTNRYVILDSNNENKEQHQENLFDVDFGFVSSHHHNSSDHVEEMFCRRTRRFLQEFDEQRSHDNILLIYVAPSEALVVVSTETECECQTSQQHQDEDNEEKELRHLEEIRSRFPFPENVYTIAVNVHTFEFIIPQRNLVHIVIPPCEYGGDYWPGLYDRLRNVVPI
eukprot:PhM_4_TR17431/c0_g1_i3/m.59277